MDKYIYIYIYYVIIKYKEYGRVSIKGHGTRLIETKAKTRHYISL